MGGRTRPSVTPALLGTGLLLLGLQAGCRSAPERELLVFSGEVMGTVFNVRIVASGPRLEDLESLVTTELTAVDDLMTTYRDSEVTRFNAWRSSEPFAVSPSTAEVVNLALGLSRSTDGALDVTVGPLVGALGFGANGARQPLPNAEELAALRRRVGFEKLDVETGTHLVKRDPELEIDLSAVAKGFAVDRAAQALSRMGVTDYMVEVGGEVRAGGFNERGERWRIGIETPDSERRQAQRIVELTDQSLATSGDYRNYREVDGHRESHLIDPRTGRSIDHRVASATVVHPDCVIADGLATAIMILGEVGIELAETEGWAVLLLVRHGEGFTEVQSSAFRRLVESAGTTSS